MCSPLVLCCHIRLEGRFEGMLLPAHVSDASGGDLNSMVPYRNVGDSTPLAGSMSRRDVGAMTEGGAGGGRLVVLTCRDLCPVTGKSYDDEGMPGGLRRVLQRADLDWCRTGTSATRLRSLDPCPDETSVP